MLFAAVLLACTGASLATEPALTTVAERSGFTKTGRYDEVIAGSAASEAPVHASRTAANSMRSEGRTEGACRAMRDASAKRGADGSRRPARGRHDLGHAAASVAAAVP
jgi:hypothetical protein